jgi:hypothetical protein
MQRLADEGSERGDQRKCLWWLDGVVHGILCWTAPSAKRARYAMRVLGSQHADQIT